MQVRVQEFIRGGGGGGKNLLFLAFSGVGRATKMTGKMKCQIKNVVKYR